MLAVDAGPEAVAFPLGQEGGQVRLARAGQVLEPGRSPQRRLVLGDLALLDVDVGVREGARAARVVEVVVCEDHGVDLRGGDTDPVEHVHRRGPPGPAVLGGQPPVGGLVGEPGVDQRAPVGRAHEGEAVRHPPVALVRLRGEQVAGREPVHEPVLQDPDGVVAHRPVSSGGSSSKAPSWTATIV
ncbi:hypothetical protein LUW74_39340 [Actinomadura madurae]|nr:hypothetical protein [Actinomadura madurae]URN08828.1 hypothetical protein LUW74_39340 [Actinomadura madurae]